MQRAFLRTRRTSGTRTENTGRPTMPDSICALVLMPTAADRVIHRIEVVVLRRLIDRVGAAARPQHTCLSARTRSRIAATAARSRGAGESGCRASRTRGSGAERTARIHFCDELRLVGRDELRRAEIQEERLVRREADLARRTPRASCSAGARTTGRRPARRSAIDLLRLHAVHGDRLALLRLVPDEHAIGNDADQALVGQVVPAVDAQPAANTERAARFDVLDLIGSDVDERRDEYRRLGSAPR